MYKDINGYPVTINKFISDNNLLDAPVLDSQLLFECGVSFPDAFPEGIDESFFRIPFVETTNNGVIIVGSDIRYHTQNDFTKAHTGIKRSLDGGLTWEADQIIHTSNLIDTKSRKHNASTLVDRNTGRVFIFASVLDSYCENPGPIGEVFDPPALWDFVYKYSDDDGATWSEEISLKTTVYDALTNLTFPGTSTAGITLSDGTLVLSIYDGRQNENTDDTGDDWYMRTGLIYSTDHGDTWIKTNLIETYLNESAIVEFDSGIVLIGRGNNDGKKLFYTNDLGISWSAYYGNKYIQSYVCETGMIKFVSGSEWRGIVSCPYNAIERSNGTIWLTKYWRKFKAFIQFEPNAFEGYSCLAQYDNHLYMVTEKTDGIWFYDLSEFTQYLT